MSGQTGELVFHCGHSVYTVPWKLTEFASSHSRFKVANRNSTCMELETRFSSGCTKRNVTSPNYFLPTIDNGQQTWSKCSFVRTFNSVKVNYLVTGRVKQFHLKKIIFCIFQESLRACVFYKIKKHCIRLQNYTFNLKDFVKHRNFVKFQNFSRSSQDNTW